MADRPPDPSLELIVRFTQALSDVALQIADPEHTSTLSLKQLVRTNLPPAYSNRRLRLIYAGKVLADRDGLAASLNLAAQRGLRSEDKLGGAGKKGKQPVREGGVPALKLYIHCSIGDPLSAGDLTDEVSAAEDADEALKAPPAKATSSSTTMEALGQSANDTGSDSRTDSAAPRGFDRLLTTGFSAAEVAALRSQFLNVLSHTHTPDDMPSGVALLRLEDRWLDNDANASTSASPDGAGGEGPDTWGADDGRALDDFLWGNVTGFFWPFGAIVWGFREEGVWTRRRQIAVFTGVLINLVFGFARLTS